MKLFSGKLFQYVQLKYDGHWTAWRNDQLWSRDYRQTLTINRPWTLRLPRQRAVYGELYVPGKPASAVKTAIKDGSDLQFGIFEVEGLSFEEAAVFCMSRGLEFIPWVDVKDYLPRDWRWAGPDGVFHLDYAKANLPEDIEGLVFDGKYKWKPIKTVDVIVTGYKDGKNKHIGLVGAWECSLSDGTHLCNVGSLCDEHRMMEPPIGQVIEVIYDRVDSKGKLRFPRFKCFRPDKTTDQCGRDQL